MRMFIKSNIHNIVCAWVVFILIFALNYMTGYTSDDYAYRFVFQPMPDDSVEKIDGIASIIKSQIHHYNIWNGRFLAHSVVQFFMQFDKILFNIFNSIAFVSLGFIIKSIISEHSKVHSKTTVYILFGMMWLLIPDFGKTVLWVSGAGNYLWMSLFYSLFILFIIKDKPTNSITVLLAITIGFLAGATNENSGPAAMLIASIIIIYDYFQFRAVKLWKIVSLIFSCIGSYLIISAPGSKRMGGVDMSMDVLIKHFINVFNADVSLFFVGYICLISFVAYAITCNKLSVKNWFFITTLMLGHFSALYSMVLSPYFVTRAAFGSSVFLIITISYVYNLISNSSVYRNISLISVSLISIIVYLGAFKDIRRSYFEVRENNKVLSTKTSNDDVSLKILTKPVSSYNAYNGTANITPYKHAWFNQWMAKYYNVKSITGYNR
ncbi:DUF3329 domain-containing protein [Pseudocitrobacter sp. MW920760]|uniref:DUF3329 domain-containing protein n=1 Tax=Pseudocitrobacter sp. MW920760 TaxID=2981140 RepID=UPI002E16C594